MITKFKFTLVLIAACEAVKVSYFPDSDISLVRMKHIPTEVYATYVKDYRSIKFSSSFKIRHIGNYVYYFIMINCVDKEILEYQLSNPLTKPAVDIISVNKLMLIKLDLYSSINYSHTLEDDISYIFTILLHKAMSFYRYISYDIVNRKAELSLCNQVLEKILELKASSPFADIYISTYHQ